MRETDERGASEHEVCESDWLRHSSGARLRARTWPRFGARPLLEPSGYRYTVIASTQAGSGSVQSVSIEPVWQARGERHGESAAARRSTDETEQHRRDDDDDPRQHGGRIAARFVNGG